MKAAGLPIGETEVYTAATDPNELLGRPGQYTGKAAWHDTRRDLEKDSEGHINWSECGGTVEVFGSEEDAQRRKDYVDAIARSGGLFAEYSYLKGRVLLRITNGLTPDQAANYESALQSLEGT